MISSFHGIHSPVEPRISQAGMTLSQLRNSVEVVGIPCSVEKGLPRHLAVRVWYLYFGCSIGASSCHVLSVFLSLLHGHVLMLRPSLLLLSFSGFLPLNASIQILPRGLQSMH